MSAKPELIEIAELERRGAIVAIQDGNHGELHPKATDYVEDGIPFIMANSFVGNSVDVASTQKLPVGLAEKLRIGFAQDGDVLLTHKGADPFWMLTPQVTYYRVNPDQLDGRYLTYAFREPVFQKTMKSRADQATRPYIGILAQRQLKIIYRAPEEQKRIVHALDPYDAMIANNRRRIELLEQSAQILFKEWFVWLRYPGHEHDKIVDGVPHGWHRSKLSSLGPAITGKTPPKSRSENFGLDIPLIKTPDMRQAVIVIDTEEFLSERGAATQKGKTLPKYSTLVSCIGTVGIVALNGLPAQTNQQINSIIPARRELRFFNYFVACDLKPRLEAIGGGVTMANVNKSKFEALPVLLPTESLLHDFDAFCDPIFEKILLLESTNRILAKARDLLLPRLMDGRIPV